VDKVVHRRDLRGVLSRILRTLMKRTGPNPAIESDSRAVALPDASEG
jgi:acetyl-CoA carboxylase beta subunit